MKLVGGDRLTQKTGERGEFGPKRWDIGGCNLCHTQSFVELLERFLDRLHGDHAPFLNVGASAIANGPPL